MRDNATPNSSEFALGTETKRLRVELVGLVIVRSTHRIYSRRLDNPRDLAEIQCRGICARWNR